METEPNKTNRNIRYSRNKTDFSYSGFFDNEIKVNQIPLTLKISVLFANIFSLAGIIFTIIGLSVMIFMLSLSNIKSADVPENSPETDGIIIAAEPTNTYINDRLIYKFTFSYNTPDGQTHQSVSYSGTVYKETGEKVTVKYNRENYTQAVISGMEADKTIGFIFIFLLIFPLIGIVMLYFGFKKGLKNIRILQFGKPALGKFIRKEQTNASINKQKVYKFYFEFTAPDKNIYTATGETHKSFLVEDEFLEPVIYNSVNPAEAVVVDTLPANVRRFFKTEINAEIEKSNIIKK